jgi:SAM-dependent methyltransferase
MTGLPVMTPTATDLPRQVIEALRPSEYTAALIHVLRERLDWVRGAAALEIGSGSGVVLAALGALGAATLCGVDIEADAVVVGRTLLCELGFADRAECHHGDLWEPVAGRRFDLIAANLPHFPMEPTHLHGRLPSWSSGGIDGRRLLDRFLRGLPGQLAAGGRAVITHNSFVDLALSQELVADARLSLRVAATTLVYIPPAKLELMTHSVLRAEEGRSIHRYGPHAFGELHIVEIGTAAALG